MASVKQFVSSDCGNGRDNGNGCGDGWGNGCGNGWGNGNGCGDGYGDGWGDGNGCGDGWGNGCGCGDGWGNGNGCGDGDGDGNGCGKGNLKYCGKNINVIDGVPTVIEKVYSQAVGKGFIINSDYTTTPTWVVKHQDLFAHGSTLREAQSALQDKIISEMPTEERIAEFVKHFSYDKKYPAKIFFDWHNRLTGSCLQGREVFVRNRQINLEADEFTVAEFIDLCKGEYGGEVISQLEGAFDDK